MSQWNTLFTLLREERQQRCDEGVVVPTSLADRMDALDPVADAWNEPVVFGLYDELMALPADPALAAAEPNDLDAIRSLRPQGPRDLRWSPSEAELLDRLHGAWTGRAAGCALGKPVELIGCTVSDGLLTGRPTIKRYLENRGDWPLMDYFSGRDVGDGIILWCEKSQREHIAFMEPDDDIHYSLTGLGVIEQYGPEFTWQNVADFWMAHIPIAAICTAEAQAILNFMNRTARWGSDGGARTAATASFCRSHRNPYREWIGAQIRSDGWAWVCAGKPELAAEFAYRDACWTHERNGIYGEMLFAAIQAAAFVVSDPRELIAIGLSEIPYGCRLAGMIRETLSICAAAADWEAATASVEDLCNEMSGAVMSPVHTINNAALCVVGLLYGRMDTVDSISIAVMAGCDTDCNAATVGSIVGAVAGRSQFRDELAGRLHDTIRPSLIGFQDVTMKELAGRTAVQWHRVDEYARRRGADGSSWLSR